jgi:hypothetical protein
LCCTERDLRWTKQCMCGLRRHCEQRASLTLTSRLCCTELRWSRWAKQCMCVDVCMLNNRRRNHSTPGCTKTVLH